MRVPATASWCLLLLTAPDGKDHLFFLAEFIERHNHRITTDLGDLHATELVSHPDGIALVLCGITQHRHAPRRVGRVIVDPRSEEHTSELQSLAYLLCRL